MALSAVTGAEKALIAGAGSVVTVATTAAGRRIASV
jgi:hypothetical protein